MQLTARGGLFLSPVHRGFFCFGDGRQTIEDVKREQLAGRETFLEKGSLSPRPSLPKTFAAGLRFASGPVHGWEWGCLGYEDAQIENIVRQRRCHRYPAE